MSLVIFSVFDTEIATFFIRNGVRLITEGLGLKKIAEFGGFTFFFGQDESV